MTAVERAATRKQEMYSNQQQKADFLQSLMGKGILMLSLSMIKYRYIQDQHSLESVEEGNIVGLYNYQVEEIRIHNPIKNHSGLMPSNLFPNNKTNIF